MKRERVAVSKASSGIEPPKLEVPTLEEYHIERELGRGGEAIVYLARELRHDRVVALKVLRPELSASIHSERFLREIATLSSLAHPNILPLLASGKSGETLYYTMPFIEGESLRRLLEREGQIPIGEAIRIVREVAEALDHAHRHGIIHRDIKPENILMADGRPLVADFGIARALGQSRLTHSGLAIGSPRYMSPEQVGSDPHADARSDIYSLGCVLYELLAGDPPFRGTTSNQVCAQHLAAPVPSIRILRPTVSRALERIVRRALAKSPADRFRTSGEFATALRRWDENRSRFPHAGDALLAPFRSQPLIATLAVILLAGGSLWTTRPGGSRITATTPGRVVVAPLENRTGSAEFDPIGLMLADWVTTGLQRVRALEVVPTPIAAQAFRFATSRAAGERSARDPVRGVAAETGAQIVVTGAIYRRGDRLLFRVEATDAPAGRLLVTIEDVEASAVDPIPGVEEVRARLMGWFAGQYDDRISSEIAEGVRPPVYQAYVAFSEGLDHYISADFAAALPAFLRSHAVDSSFTAALLYASLCHSNLGQYAQSDSLLGIVQSHREQLTEYQRAWLDYRLAFLAGDHTAALSAIRAAASLAPDSKASYNYAVTAFQSGRPAEALAVLTGIAPERGPMRGFLPYWDVLGAVHHAMGRYDLEREVGEKERQLYPERLLAFIPSLRALAVDGRLQELDSVLRQVETLPADPVGFNLGDLLREVAEELRAHRHNDASERMFERAHRWYRLQEQVGPGLHTVDVRNPGHARSSIRRPLARVAYDLGRYEEADSLVVLLRSEYPRDPQLLGLRGLLEARRGRRDGALAVSDSLRAQSEPYQFGAVALHRARIVAVLGDRHSAVARVREGFAEGAPYDLWLHRDHDLAELRDEPALASLIAPQR